MPSATHGLSPLSDEEIEELEAFLMEDRDGAEAMMFDTMDGYMHAVAIGPTTPNPQQWLPPIWGHMQAQGMVPADRPTRGGRLRTRPAHTHAHAGTAGQTGAADPRDCPRHAHPLASPAPGHSRTFGERSERSTPVLACRFALPDRWLG
jgi:hypothetical protein